MICRREAVLALRRCGVGVLASGGGWCEGETGVRCGAGRGAG